ncbi:hydrogenase expression/formation protein HypD [Lachnospiraceae bacterium NE2001]|nr:hydrogenase expression/formation protein HypD [Lachnospiraceae bacterium NE2001]
MSEVIKNAREIIQNYNGPKLRIMEVCGTHTHEIFKMGIRNLLPENIDLISGPGCPVCVTPVGFIDEAIYLALEKGCVITTFGDLIKVPGTKMSLAGARSEGADVRPVYSPDDAVELAKENPDMQVVFLSVGFETTTPSSCLAVKKAQRLGLSNFSILTANKTMPSAYAKLAGSADAFLFPGHVNAIAGNSVCKELVGQGVSGVVAGFTASELMTALAVIIEESKKGEPFFVNCYPRVVKDEGNPAAQKLVESVMEPCDTEWRGLGMIEKSGMKLREEYALFDARKKYEVPDIQGKPNPACQCGEVLQGNCKPTDCPLFGKVCDPIHPVGACMVSDEGACAAYYHYGSSLNLL